MYVDTIMANQPGRSQTRSNDRLPTSDAPMGPRRPHCAKLNEAEETLVVELRRRTLLPLDDLLGHLRESLPQLSRSALHRYLVRHGISRRPSSDEHDSKRGRFSPTQLGYLHIDSCELRAALGARQEAHVPGC